MSSFVHACDFIGYTVKLKTSFCTLQPVGMYWLCLCSSLEYASHYLCQQCHETSTWFCIINNRYFSLGLFKEPKWLFSQCVCRNNRGIFPGCGLRPICAYQLMNELPIPLISFCQSVERTFVRTTRNDVSVSQDTIIYHENKGPLRYGEPHMTMKQQQ